MSSEEYATKASELPDICIAFKCSIKEMNKILDNKNIIPDFSGLVDKDKEKNADSKSSLSGSIITGVKYSAFAKINNDLVNIDLAESEIQQANKFDVNPLIYFRLSNPLKEGVTLPLIDLKQVYGQSIKWGFEVEVIPDTSY